MNIHGSPEDRSPHLADRLEVHNASTDEKLAEKGACAHIHLPTGRVCVLESGHPGSCEFVRADGR